MKALSKAAVATGAAAVLLLGGLGSSALWSDEVMTAHGSVSTGTLAISDGVPGTWTDVSTSPSAPFDPATEFLVPGDVVEVPVRYTVDAHGENLRATVVPNFDGSTTPVDVWVDFPEMTLDRDGEGGQAPEPFDPTTDLVQPGEGQILTVRVRISFAQTAQASQDEEVDVSGLRVTVAQVRP